MLSIPSVLANASFQSVYEFFVQGGVFMGLLLVCSWVALAVIILRTIALRRDLVMPPIIEREIEALQPEDHEAVTTLSRMIRNDNSTLARIAQVGLQNLNWPKMENLEAVQTKARHEIVRLFAGTRNSRGIQRIHRSRIVEQVPTVTLQQPRGGGRHAVIAVDPVQAAAVPAERNVRCRGARPFRRHGD